MREELQEALVAVKAGNDEKARLLLAELLKDEPQNVPAWVLLSKLATSDVQKAAFLRKVLALEPAHSYAQQELSRMGAAVAGEQAAVTETTAVEAEAESDVASEAVESLGAVVEPAAESDEAAESEAAPESGDFEPQPWESEDLPWIDDEDEIVTAEPLDDSLDWFLPAEEEEEAIESSLQELTREGADVSAEEAARGDVPDDDVSHGDVSHSDVERSYAAQAESDTPPPWIPDDEVVEAAGAAELPTDGERVDEDEIPDWLQEGAGADWLDDEEEALTELGQPPSAAEEARAAETEAKLAAAMASGRRETAEASPTSPWLLAALVLVAALVFLAIVYAAYIYLF